MTTEVHREPANDDWHSRVTATCHQKQCCVSQLQVRRSGQQHGESSNANRNRYQREEEAVSQSVRCPRNQHGEAKSRDPRWH